MTRQKEAAALTDSVQAAVLVQRRPPPWQRRNRLLALILASVAIGILLVALSVVLAIHDVEAGHVFKNF